MQNSLGDAPAPPDPIEGLEDPPPSYNEIGTHKKIDPLRYTTTNTKGNEPGYMHRITPRILETIKSFLLEQREFDAKAKAQSQNFPPAHNAMAKQQKRTSGATADSSITTAASANSNASFPVFSDPTESLETLPGTRSPGLTPLYDAPVHASGIYLCVPRTWLDHERKGADSTNPAMGECL